VIFAQMVDDPSSHPDLFPTEEAQEKERQRLCRIIEDFVQWENTTDEAVLQRARDEIWQSWRYACAANADHPRARELFDRHKLPAFHDPFAGSGAIPLEAQWLGLEAFASDLNRVAALINKAMIEIPPKFAGRPTAVVNPGRVVSPVRLAGPRRVQTMLNTKGGPSAWLTRVGPARQTGACRWQDWYESPARPGRGQLRCTPRPEPGPPRQPSSWCRDTAGRFYQPATGRLRGLLW
jgi:adenine-specific DNA methylase